MAHARGAWIAPLDQDDEWAPDHLEVLLAAAAATGAEVVYGVSRVVLDDGTETFFGSWPPTLGDFGFQTAIYHAGLAALLYDANSHLVGEPADWNLARRMLEAGVSFEFVEQRGHRLLRHPGRIELRRLEGAPGGAGRVRARGGLSGARRHLRIPARRPRQRGPGAAGADAPGSRSSA